MLLAAMSWSVVATADPWAPTNDIYSATGDSLVFGPCDGGIEELVCFDGALDDFVRWDLTYREDSPVGRELSYLGGVQNLLSIPLIVTLSHAVDEESSSVCSIARFTANSAGSLSEVYEDTFILAPYEGDLTLGEELITDSITFQLKGAAEAVGSCKVAILASVAAVDTGSIQADDPRIEPWFRYVSTEGPAAATRNTETETTEPQTVADLGSVVVDCASQQILISERDAVVLASFTDVELHVTYSDACEEEFGKGWVNIHVTTAPFTSEHANQASVIHSDTMKEPGTKTSSGRWVAPEGDTTLYIGATFYESMYTWDCAIELGSYGFALSALAAKMVVSAAFGFFAAGYDSACFGLVKFHDSAEVTVTGVTIADIAAGT